MPEGLRWSDAALQRGRDVAVIYGERATWLLSLGLPADSARVYQSALAATGPAANRDRALIHAACAAAVERGGADALRSFLKDNGLAETDDPEALFVMANAALMARDASLANELLARAKALPEKADMESGWQAMFGTSYLLVRASALQAAGNVQAAARDLDTLAGLLARLVDAGVQTRGLFELQAQLAAMRGQPEAAMSALRRAVELGWTDVWLAEHQPYFDTLRDRDDFRELLAAVSRRNTATAASLESRLLAVSGEAG
jgi:tetratricopeptide (TPR) repeat protein